MRILIVEDDEFKAADVLKAVEETGGDMIFTRAASVTSALRRISAESFELCVLDMSLPTFDLSGPGGGGSPQSQGGIEVLRLAKRLSSPPPFIIVTQYPDIEISGKDIPLLSATAILCDRFSVPVLACLLYEFDGMNWKAPLKTAVSAMRQA
jgi:CheY-like chemotaxis protein